MSRLRRFPENRFVGKRDEMVVYDCDDHDQFEHLTTSLDQPDGGSILLQAFAPDALVEAANRGFKPAK